MSKDLKTKQSTNNTHTNNCYSSKLSQLTSTKFPLKFFVFVRCLDPSSQSFPNSHEMHQEKAHNTQLLGNTQTCITLQRFIRNS